MILQPSFKGSCSGEFSKVNKISSFSSRYPTPAFFFSHGREAESGEACVVGIGCLVCDLMGMSLGKVLRGIEMEGAGLC